ncbi:MAG TPA: hypothetical protein VMF58_01800 [Rhizomicrobium sp.]|nr:hypothetical protein [Rhizomicrobium sp.]
MSANRTRTTLFAALTVICAGFAGALASSPARAEGVEIEGMAAAPYSSGLFSGRADEKTRQQVLLLAEYDALGRYAANFSMAKFKLYQGVEHDIKAHIEDYISQPTVVDEGYRKTESKYFIVIRTTINTNRLEAELNGAPDHGGVAQAMPQRKIAISFLFVARSTSSVKSFNDRVTSVEVNSEDKSAKQSQGLHGGSAKFSSSYQDTTVHTTGGNTVRQADQVTYVVSSPEDMNASMSQVFSDNGFDVYDYRDVSAQCGGAKPETMYQAFSSSDILSRELRKSAFDAAKQCSVNTFATGTLDVGLQDTDPVTGQKRVYVSVRAQLNDLSGPLPRVLASVGPVQYSGLGPDQQVAGRNALLTAASEAAKEISNQLRSKGLN